jgi:AraC-like DNA-binding protein
MCRFFGAEPSAYVSLGAQCARWAVTEGPYRSFIADRDFQQFVEFFPFTWRTYFLDTSSYCTTQLVGDTMEFEVFDLPQWHPYFEYFVVGYLKGALETICANPIRMRRMHGGAGTHYKYMLWAGAAERGVDPTDIPRPGSRQHGPELEKVVAFIEAHLGGDIGLPQLARLVDFSPDYLARLFKSSFGLPPHQYVMRRRIERAKGLLSQRGSSVAEIAHACGFASQSHFAAAFKAKEGITPAAHRLRSKIQ